jgi:hypothetical protein
MEARQYLAISSEDCGGCRLRRGRSNKLSKKKKKKKAELEGV